MAKRIRTKAAERQKNKDTRPKAFARYIRMSPYKVRRAIDLVRGKSYTDAIAILKNTPLGRGRACYQSDKQRGG